jgi:hypothetical protein
MCLIVAKEHHIFMHITGKNKVENILIKFWTFGYGCVLKQFLKTCKQCFQIGCLVWMWVGLIFTQHQ